MDFELVFAIGNSHLWSSETFQRPLWNVSKEPGLPRPPLAPQPVLESPQLRPNEGPAESDPDCYASPAPCHRSPDHAFDFSRTRNIQDGSEGTWNSLQDEIWVKTQMNEFCIYYLRVQKKPQSQHCFTLRLQLHLTTSRRPRHLSALPSEGWWLTETDTPNKSVQQG